MRLPAPSVRAELLRLAAAVAIAGAVTYLVYRSLPDELIVRTDIVGYPTFNAFNISRYLWVYELCWFFPLATVGLYALFQRLARRGQPRRPRVPPAVGEDEPRRPPGPVAARAGAVARVLLVGSVLGLELALWTAQTSGWIWGVVVPSALVYAAVAAGLAYGLARLLGRPFWQLLAAVNAAGTALTIAGVYGISAGTQVRVTGGAVHHYSFFPWWLALLGAAALVTWLALSWRRQGLGASTSLEPVAVVLTAAPAALFAFVATLAQGLGPMDLFHEGESLAAAHLTRGGAFPWRDLLFIHGPLFDILRPLTGLELFGDSRWAALTGWWLILAPLGWIALFGLCAYLFRRNWLFLVASQLAVVTGAVYALDLRFLLLPVLLLLLIALLREATWPRAAGFALALVVQVIASPEAGIAAVALVATVVCFELYYRDPSRPLVASFRRTILVAAGGAAGLAVWVVFLAAFGALGSFVFYYRTFTPGHELTGGIPIGSVSAAALGVTPAQFRFVERAPVVLAVLAFLFFAVRMRFRWPIRVEDWAMGGATLFAALYYTKFLARADHVFESFAVTIPVLFYAAYRAIDLLAGRLPPALRRPGTYALTIVALVITLQHAPRSPGDALRAIPSHFNVTVDSEPTMSQVGYGPPGAVDPALLADMGTITKAYLGPKDTFFDMTNSPGLFHYLLHLRPATRYYHVSMAIRQKTQSDLVAELERAKPKLVAFTSTGFGLYGWDGIWNPVRHYDVSQYLLDHYKPLLLSHGYLLMGREGATLPPPASIQGLVEPALTTGQLYLNTLPCDWGATPNFLTTGPAPGAKSVSVLAAGPTSNAKITLSGWAADGAAGKPAAEVVAAVGPDVIARFPVTGDRPDVATALRKPGVRFSGFNGIVRLKSAQLPGLRLYGITQDRRASELTYGPSAGWRPEPGTPPPSLTLPDGTSVDVVKESVQSNVDAATLVGGPKAPVPFDFATVLKLDRPAGAERYHWLEIESKTPLRAGSFAVSDRANLGNPGSSITFRTLGRGPRSVRVQIGACSQWRAYQGPLYLAMSEFQDVKAVRLLQ